MYRRRDLPSGKRGRVGGAAASSGCCCAPAPQAPVSCGAAPASAPPALPPPRPAPLLWTPAGGHSGRAPGAAAPSRSPHGPCRSCGGTLFPTSSPPPSPYPTLSGQGRQDPLPLFPTGPSHLPTPGGRGARIPGPLLRVAAAAEGRGPTARTARCPPPLLRRASRPPHPLGTARPRPPLARGVAVEAARRPTAQSSWSLPTLFRWAPPPPFPRGEGRPHPLPPVPGVARAAASRGVAPLPLPPSPFPSLGRWRGPRRFAAWTVTMRWGRRRLGLRLTSRPSLPLEKNVMSVLRMAAVFAAAGGAARRQPPMGGGRASAGWSSGRRGS